MNSDKSEKENDNIFENKNEFKKEETNAVKNFIKNVMINLPGKNFYSYGKKIKKIFEELKKT